jgi:multidrug efflux pump subunit AcrB
MTRFNVSDWALSHRSFVYFLMIVAVIAGSMSYMRLGREEDPAFSIKTMVVSAQWPGATVGDTLDQVTDRIEKEIQQVDLLDYTRSYTTPGHAIIFVNFKDSTPPDRLKDLFYQVRKHINDIRNTFPDNTGIGFDDEFGDVFGNIYAFTADGLSMRQLRDYVEGARSAVLRVPNIGKTEIFGTQDEVIYLDFSARKLAGYGLDVQSVIKTLQAENAIVPSGVIQSGAEQVSVRVSGQFRSEESLKAVNLRLNDRFFRLSDIADIRRGYVDPPQEMFRFNGQPAIGLGIAMRQGGNLLAFGQALKAQMRKFESTLPIGVGIHLVSDQPRVVEEAVGGFTEALVEAVVIVLAVSFISLGVRAGIVVSISIPLVLAVTFIVLQAWGITLQRISLGALIIALGLLVDDAMITVEMMVARLEAGDSKHDAAIFAYTSTAFPMLTGTLVTVCGFLPIGFNGSAAGEYTHSLFVVLAASLLISWFVAVVFAPLVGVIILPKTMKKHDEAKPGFLMRLFRGILLTAMRGRWITVILSVAALGVAIFGMRFVQQQFFPSSDRPEILVDLTLPQMSSIEETRKQMDRFEKRLDGDPNVVHWSSYVGQGAIRFYLPLDEQLQNAFFGQIVIVTKSLEARNELMAQLRRFGREQFVGTDVFVHSLDLGPPVGRPIQYRLSGPDVQTVRDKALTLASIVATNAHIDRPTYDWNEPGEVIRVEILQDKARALGITSEDIANILNGVVGGTTITQVRDSIYLVNIVGRAQTVDRKSIDSLATLQVNISNGRTAPLLSFAKLSYDLEQPIVWRRDRLPTVTVSATIRDETQPPTIVAELAPRIDAFAKALPTGYFLATGGSVEEAGKGQGPIITVVPVMLLAMAFVLMVQLQSFSKLALVVSVAPFGLIGVVSSLLPARAPLGFVAILGVLALIGIIIRNSVILVTQIDEYEAEGRAPWDAVIDATLHRVRPILITAAAASLAMIPIARQVFWGPMAYAMIGGILAGTVLTLLFLPALYVAAYRIRPDTPLPVPLAQEPPAQAA